MTDSPRTDSARPDSFHPQPLPHNSAAQSHDSAAQSHDSSAQSHDLEPLAAHPAHRAHGSYEGTDPEFGPKAGGSRRINVSTVQVGASAAAAVTSALAASFFGVAGTLIGAAVGSIVSTVAGALYADYLKRAGHRIKATKSVVIQRIPADVLATTPLRHRADPASLPSPADLPSPVDLPRTAPLRSAGSEPAAHTVSVPLAGETELLAGLNAVDPATVISPTPGPPLPARDPAPRRAWYRRPLITLPAIGLAGFLIALGVVTVGEGAIGGPISGGNGGTTVSKVFHHSSRPVTTKPAPTPRDTPSTAATQSAGPTSPIATGSAAAAPTAAAPTTALSSSVPATPAAPSTQPDGGAPTGGAGPQTGGAGAPSAGTDGNGAGTHGNTVGGAG